MNNFPGVAARLGAGRPYERNVYPQTTPLNQSDNIPLKKSSRCL